MLALLYIILCLVKKDSDAAIIGEYKYSGYGISFYSKNFPVYGQKDSSQICNDIWLRQ